MIRRMGFAVAGCARVVVLAAALSACGSGREHAPAGNGLLPLTVGADGPGAKGLGGTAIDPGPPPISELEARDRLRRSFRAAGLRVVSDVPLRGAGYDITVDGYDPERQVGFEYIAADERDTDVGAGEREALADAGSSRVLVVDATAAEALQLVTDAFLARLAAERAAADRTPGVPED